jgi:hypothetical protein
MDSSQNSENPTDFTYLSPRHGRLGSTRNFSPVLIPPQVALIERIFPVVCEDGRFVEVGYK